MMKYKFNDLSPENRLNEIDKGIARTNGYLAYLKEELVLDPRAVEIVKSAKKDNDTNILPPGYSPREKMKELTEMFANGYSVKDYLETLELFNYPGNNGKINELDPYLNVDLKNFFRLPTEEKASYIQKFKKFGKKAVPLAIATVFGAAVLATGVAADINIDPEDEVGWKCYSGGTEMTMTKYDNPELKDKYLTCFPNFRNIGKPAEELKTCMCTCDRYKAETGDTELDLLNDYPEILLAKKCENILHCKCVDLDSKGNSIFRDMTVDQVVKFIEDGCINWPGGTLTQQKPQKADKEKPPTSEESTKSTTSTTYTTDPAKVPDKTSEESTKSTTYTTDPVKGGSESAPGYGGIEFMGIKQDSEETRSGSYDNIDVPGRFGQTKSSPKRYIQEETTKKSSSQPALVYDDKAYFDWFERTGETLVADMTFLDSALNDELKKGGEMDNIYKWSNKLDQDAHTALLELKQFDDVSPELKAVINRDKQRYEALEDAGFYCGLGAEYGFLEDFDTCFYNLNSARQHNEEWNNLVKGYQYEKSQESSKITTQTKKETPSPTKVPVKEASRYVPPKTPPKDVSRSYPEPAPVPGFEVPAALGGFGLAKYLAKKLKKKK